MSALDERDEHRRVVAARVARTRQRVLDGIIATLIDAEHGPFLAYRFVEDGTPSGLVALYDATTPYGRALRAAQRYDDDDD